MSDTVEQIRKRFDAGDRVSCLDIQVLYEYIAALRTQLASERTAREKAEYLRDLYRRRLDELEPKAEKAEARLVEITGKVFKFLERYDYFNSLDGVEDPTPQEELEELRESLPSDVQALVERHKAGEEALALLTDPRLHSTWTIDHVNGEGWRVNDLNTGHDTGWLPTLLDTLRAAAKGNKP
jgi:hypothetical protein